MCNFKILTVTGSRKEMITLSAVIRTLDAKFDHSFIHTGKTWDYDPNKYFFADISLRSPDKYLECLESDTFPVIISKLYDSISKINPDLIIYSGNSISRYAAIVAKELNIPVFFIPAGILTDKKPINHTTAESFFADLPSPILQLMSEKYDKIAESYILTDLELEDGKYLFISLSENTDFRNSLSILNEIAQRFKYTIICHISNTGKELIEKSKMKFHPLIKFITKLSFTAYCKLGLSARIFVTDSDTIIEESEILGISPVYIGNNKEIMLMNSSKTSVIAGTGEKLPDIIAGLLSVEYEKTVLLKPRSFSDISNKIAKFIETYLIYNSGEAK